MPRAKTAPNQMELWGSPEPPKPTTTGEPCLLIVDADNLIHRAFHAIPAMKGANGEPSNALRGLLGSIFALHQQLGNVTQTICAFDSGVPTFRREAAPTYKTGREKKDDTLIKQLRSAREILTPALGWTPVSAPNVEADDILWTLCIQAKKAGQKAVIASGDKDTAQCLSLHDSFELMRPPKKSGDAWPAFNSSTVKDLLGVTADQIPGYLALIGDSSDNLPGIPGAGPVTVQKWFAQYGTLPEILAHKDELEPKRLRDRIDPAQIEKNLLVTQAYDTGHQIPEKAPQSPELETILRDYGLYRFLNHLK